MKYDTPKVTVILNKTTSAVSDTCPTATNNIKENIKNRDWTIKSFGYGPLNPDAPDPGFWEKKAELWNSDVATVKTALCGNCAAFDQTNKILCCIVDGINETKAADPMDVQNLADLGYCQLFKFKCAASRTCDAWLHGGPIQDCDDSL
tara:strand:+ start:55 stop:498 length:444 start_codon:yes stop_codon:yes gene_type:complete